MFFPNNQFSKRKGDWDCPNASCINYNSFVFAKNKCCPACGSPKPPPGQQRSRSSRDVPAVQQEAQIPYAQWLAQQDAEERAREPTRIQYNGNGHSSAGEKVGNDWTCRKCGHLNFRREMFKTGNTCKKCYAPREVAKDMDWADVCKQFRGGRSRSRGRRKKRRKSSSSSSSSSSASKKSKRSVSSSSSKSSSRKKKGGTKDTEADADAAPKNPELEKAKHEALEKVLSLKNSDLNVEEKKRQWRSLLREWHPDKHSDKELATAVFQYLQKAKSLMNFNS